MLILKCFHPIIPLDWLSDFPGKPSDNANVVNASKQENQETASKTSTVKGSEVTALRATNIRKTSISMPSKLNEMDDLRIDRQNVSLIYLLTNVTLVGNVITVAVTRMRSYAVT